MEFIVSSKKVQIQIGTNTFKPATSPNSQQQLAAASAGYIKLLEDFGNFHWCDQRGLNQLDSSAHHYVCSTLHMSYRYTYSTFIYISAIYIYIYRQNAAFLSKMIYAIYDVYQKHILRTGVFSVNWPIYPTLFRYHWPFSKSIFPFRLGWWYNLGFFNDPLHFW